MAVTKNRKLTIWLGEKRSPIIRPQIRLKVGLKYWAKHMKIREKRDTLLEYRNMGRAVTMPLPIRKATSRPEKAAISGRRNSSRI